MNYNDLEIFQIFAMSSHFLRHPLKRNGFGSGLEMILKDDLWSFSTEFSTFDTGMVGLGLVGRVLQDMELSLFSTRDRTFVRAHGWSQLDGHLIYIYIP